MLSSGVFKPLLPLGEVAVERENVALGAEDAEADELCRDGVGVVVRSVETGGVASDLLDGVVGIWDAGGRMSALTGAGAAAGGEILA